MMTTRFATMLLLATTALTGGALAQDAAPTDAPVTAPAPGTPASRSQNQISPTFQTAPTDIGRVNVGAGLTGGAAQTGVTGQAPGGGLIVPEDAPKSRSTVTQEFIGRMSPTANPFQMLALVPGANIGSPDAYGLNGGTFSVRGLRADQIGFTIEGAPVNDSGNYAIYPQEYIDAENMQQIVLSQGSADLDSPHIGASGGVVNMYLRDPLRTPGGLLNLSYGSSEARRVFGRVDSGEIDAGFARTRMFVSASDYHADHWRGPGTDQRNNVEFKTVTEFGQDNRISFALLYNDAQNNFYRNPTLAQWNQYGKNFNYNATPTSATDTNYFRYAVNPFKNLVLSAPSHFTLTDNLSYDVVPYYWYGYGNGGGATVLNESALFFGNTRLPNQDLNGNGRVTDKVLTYSPSITQTNRPGLINKLAYNWENHHLIAGYWFEWAEHIQTGPYTVIPTDNLLPTNFWGNSGNITINGGPYAGQTLMKRDTITHTTTNALFAGDTIGLLNDRLNLDIGIKQVWVNRSLENLLPGANRNQQIDNAELLPTGAVRYRLNDRQQVFGSVSSNFRTPQNLVMFDSFNTSGVLTQRGVTDTKVERSLSEELGWRYQGESVLASVTGFLYQFSNRQVTTSVLDPAGGSAYISSALNVGNTQSRGIDLEAGTTPFHNFRPYVSFEYLNTEITDNYRASGTLNGKTVTDYLVTKNKAVPQSPRFQTGAGLFFDNGLFFSNFLVKYVDRQASTFTNDEYMKAFTRLDAMVGMYLPSVGLVKDPTLRVNFYNLTDSRHLTGVNGVTTNSNASRGLFGSTIAGSAPTYLVGNGFAAIATISAPFSF